MTPLALATTDAASSLGDLASVLSPSTLVLASEITFRHPERLLALLLVAPAAWLAVRSRAALGGARLAVALAFRVLLIALLAAVLAEPDLVRRGEGVTTTVLLDRSRSVPVPLQAESAAFVREAAEARERGRDRVAVVAFAGDSVINALADTVSEVEVVSEPADLEATDLADAVRTALAIMPDDTSNRLLLVSDGNQTTGSVLAAAEIALAGGVPVDYLLLEYDRDREVVLDEVIAPSRARPGQTVRVRAVLTARDEVAGTLRTTVNGTPIGGEGRRVVLQPGPNAFEETIAADRPGAYRFETTFVPDDPAADAVDVNNRGDAVTFVSGEGRVLVFDEQGEGRDLVRALLESGIEAEVREPSAWTGGLVEISAYDAVVLVDQPVWNFTREQDRLLHAYVHDLGGGLVMVGGDRSFGAGGWIDSQTARTLPVRLDPPQTRQMPAGALAIVMHSCEMPRANYWSQQVAEAAINALSRLDYVGIIEFNWGVTGPGVIEGCSWAFPMQRLGDKSAALAATRTMSIGDMPSFQPSMQLAVQGLTSVPAAQRHTIIISDGDASPPLPSTLQAFRDNRITISTVLLAGHGSAGDRSRMQQVASSTGGEFYEPQDPNQLPQIFFKEASTISRSLIQDGERRQPAVLPVLSGPAAGFQAVPPIDGYVLTVPRDGLALEPMVIPNEEGDDPLLAHWNYGLGRTVAWTSDVTNLWGAEWVSWERFRAFWEQNVRWSLRSTRLDVDESTGAEITLETRVDGDEAVIEAEARGPDAAALDFVDMNAVVVAPSGETRGVTLQQVGPGRYRARFPLEGDGSWLVNLSYSFGSGENRTAGSRQAAVSLAYPREYRDTAHNEALLRSLAEMTGGRRIAPDDPRAVDLFADEGLPVPRLPRPIWDLLAVIAAALLVLDVAGRRLSVEGRTMRAAARLAVAKREAQATDSLEAFRRVRGGEESAPGGARPAEGAGAPDAERRFDASDAEHAARGADLLQGDAGDAKRAARRTPAPAPEEETPDETATTSRLLAAKRRARGGTGPVEPGAGDRDADGDGARDDSGRGGDG